MNILNIAAGKQKPLKIPYTTSLTSKYIVNIDNGYFNSFHHAAAIERMIKENGLKFAEVRNLYCKHDIFNYMEKTAIIFDSVAIYRYLEHVTFTQVNYFIYLVSTVIKKGGIVDIIVPNYDVLSQMVLDEDPFDDKNFEASNILLTTEMLNEPSCPHASIWTPLRAIYFWELEKRFKVEEKDIDPKFKFDGRDIYMRFLARRI